MGVTSRAVRRILLWVASVAQIGILIAIIHYVQKLQQLEFRAEDQSVQEVSCALDDKNWDSDNSLCTTAYAGAGITFAALFGLSIILVRSFVCFELNCSCPVYTPYVMEPWPSGACLRFSVSKAQATDSKSKFCE